MKYLGGKGQTFQKLINLMPPHDVYIETHLGGGAVIRNKKPANLMLDPYFKKEIAAGQANWRQVIQTAAAAGVPCPAFMSALAYYDGYRAERLPANLLQAQRDYFGAHTYERVDKPRGEFFHTNWTGRGGDTSASTYVV